MKIILESTDQLVDVITAEAHERAGGGAAPKKTLARVWEGQTEQGIMVRALILEIAVPCTEDQDPFEGELMAAPHRKAQAMGPWPLKFFID